MTVPTLDEIKRQREFNYRQVTVTSKVTVT